MKKIFYSLICLTTIFSLQGCFWHTHTERVIEEPSGQSSTTVVTPQPASTSTTVTTSP
jgi:hypothetical protein